MLLIRFWKVREEPYIGLRFLGQAVYERLLLFGRGNTREGYLGRNVISDIQRM